MTVEVKYDFTGVPNLVVAVWYEHRNPLAEIGRVVLNPQQQPVGIMVVEVLRRVVYDFKFFNSSNGVALESIRHEWGVDAAKFTRPHTEFYHYIVGRGQSELDSQDNVLWADPVAGSDQLIDRRLLEGTFEVSHKMIGIRAKETYIVLPEGGFGLVDGEVFEPADHWVAIVTRDVEFPVPDSGGAMGLNVVEESEDFGAAYHNNKNIAEFTSDIGITTFPPFAEIVDCVCIFSTYTGHQRYWYLQFAEGDMIRFMGEDRNVLRLATNERLEITIAGGKGYVTDQDTRYRMAGQVISGSKDLIGTVPADGRSGQEFDVSDYARMIEELSAAQTCSYSDHAVQMKVGTKTYFPYRGKFAISADNTKFRFPDLRGYSPRFLSVTDNRLSPGAMSFQVESVNLENIDVEIHDGNGGSSTNPLAAGNNGQPAGFAGMDVFRAWITNKVANQKGSERWLRFIGYGSETVPDNYGLLPLVVL